MQLMELEIPMVLALNMMDEVRSNGGSVRINQLEEILGIPVVPISAAKNEGIDELIDHALFVAQRDIKPQRVDFCVESDDPKDPVGAVHRCIHAAAMLLEADIRRAQLPVRFATTKLVEKDQLIAEKLNLAPEKQAAFDQLVDIMEKETGLDREAAMANMRFGFLETLCRKTVVRPHESKEHKRSMAIDRVLTGKYTAIPCFLGIMALVFVMTFSLIGGALSSLMELGVQWVTNLIDLGLTAWDINPVVHDLVVNGVCAGVGSVLSFLPTIVTLFFFLSILEDTGYMARVAFVMDRPLRKLGLSGRSFVPMLIGFGCSVPAVMATRTLSSERDRRMTILLTPFMSCSAKLPIYTMLVSAFFPRSLQPLAMIGLYLLGILCGILYALILKHTAFSGEPVPFVMELPNYRLPSAKSVGQLIWEKAKGFVQKAFTIIFAASVIIWVLQTFDIRLNVAATPEVSLLALLGSLISPIFKPLGFGDWRASTALITGFTAKESMVSTLTLLLGGDRFQDHHPVQPLHRDGLPGVHPAVYPLCGRHLHRKARNGLRQGGSRHRGPPVRHCLGGCLPGPAAGHAGGPELRYNHESTECLRFGSAGGGLCGRPAQRKENMQMRLLRGLQDLPAPMQIGKTLPLRTESQ